MYLDSREMRSLRLLADRPAHEIKDPPLRTLQKAADHGLVAYTEYQDVFANRKWWKQRQVIITEKGKKYLEEKKP